MNIVSCGIDLAKNIFQLYALDDDGNEIKKQLKRANVVKYFVNIHPCLIGIEACSGAHFWARELSKLGHTVKIISPHFVKPFVKGNKNDANDAEAIHEALLRPSMRFVPSKTVEQQSILMLHRIRSGYVKSRTALANQIRGLLAEFGVVLPKQISRLRARLLVEVADNDRLCEHVKIQFRGLYEELLHLDGRIREQESAILQIFKSNNSCQRLSTIPGIGPITATALVSSIGDVSSFKNGRELAAWLGIVPRQHSSGGKSVLLGISKRGDSYLRTLLIHGARSVLINAGKKEDRNSLWLKELERRRGYNKACVAQANKTARIVWAILNNESTYRLAG